MGLFTARFSGEQLLETAAEVGFTLAGGAVVLLAVTPEGRQWLAKGYNRAAGGAVVVSGAIGSLFADLKQGWSDLLQEVRNNQSAVGAPAGPGSVSGATPDAVQSPAHPETT